MKSLFLTLFIVILSMIGQSCNNHSPNTAQSNISKDTLDIMVKQNKFKPCEKIYLYDSKTVDTIMEGYHISYVSRDNDSIVISSIANENKIDTSYYACRDIILTIEHEHDSSHVIITRSMFAPFIPEEELDKYYINKFNIESVGNTGVTFYSNVCIPETDLCYFFQILISSKGNVQITDITPEEDEL